MFSNKAYLFDLARSFVLAIKIVFAFQGFRSDGEIMMRRENAFEGARETVRIRTSGRKAVSCSRPCTAADDYGIVVCHHQVAAL